MEVQIKDVGPITHGDRIQVLDVLRGLAVGGILIGNLQWFSGYGWLPPSLAALNPATDQLARFLVHAFVEGKFYSIFSFLFGFGFALVYSCCMIELSFRSSRTSYNF